MPSTCGGLKREISPRIGVNDCYGPLSGCWDPNLYPSPEQYMCLIAVTPL